MARNKYPEVTQERILAAAQRLFLQKGYDATTIQDIVNELGDLTKGAVYHHFASKEEIMDALGNKLFLENNPFTAVRRRTDLNGLQKLRELIKINQQDTARRSLSLQGVSILKNPRVLAGMLEADQRVIAPMWLELIEEGRMDGSIQTQYGPQLAELIPLLTNLWMAPSVFPADAAKMQKKFACISTMLEALGLPLVDEEIFAMAARYFAELEQTAQLQQPPLAPGEGRTEDTP